MKIGDKVRFLNDVGGGTVTGFQGKDVAIIRDDNGFDIPTLVRECVVIETDNYNFARPAAPKPDAPKPAGGNAPKSAVPVHPIEEDDERPITFKPRALERRGADKLNLMLAFVPVDVKAVSSTPFEAYLINDSNYTVHFALLCHEGAACTLRHEGEVEANTKLFLEEFTRDVLNEWERVTMQAVAFKRDKSFLPKAPLNVGLRIDCTKFYKLHTFGESDFFEEPALLCDIVRDDRPVRSVFVEAGEMEDVLVKPKSADRPAVQPARKPTKDDPKQPVVVDLHASEVLESTSGLEPKDILEYQLKIFRETMDANLKTRGRKLIFIHGKGEGVLRAAILKELKAHYKQCRWQDASFREYGFGATQVTV